MAAPRFKRVASLRDVLALDSDQDMPIRERMLLEYVGINQTRLFFLLSTSSRGFLEHVNEHLGSTRDRGMRNIMNIQWTNSQLIENRVRDDDPE